MGYGRKDALLKVTKALPTGASAVNSDAIDLETSTAGDFVANCELKISAPAVTVGMLANAATIIYKVQHDTDSAFGTAATLVDNVITQTGAGGAGAAAATATVALKVDCNRYIRVVATKSASGDASSVSMTAELLF